MPAPVILFETAESCRLGPVAATRPVWDLRLGPFTVGQLQREALPGREIHHWCRDLLVPICPRPEASLFETEEVLLVSGHLLPLAGGLDEALRDLRRGDSLTVAGHPLARKLSGREAREFLQGEPEAYPLTGGEQLVSPFGPVLRFWWEMLDMAPLVFVERLGKAAEAAGATAPKALGGEVHLAEGVDKGRGVVFDTSKGPLLIGRDVKLGALSYVGGPAYIGPDTVLRPGTRLLHGVQAGPQCRLGGEIEETLLQGYSNKQHDGFLGHAVLGQWVNLGAGTSNSDLKNSYGEIRVELGGESISTGRRFLGCCLGDHVKVGIQGRINTGTVIGPFANWFGAVFPPKSLPAFSWGDEEGLETHRLDEALETARRVMARRGCELDEATESVYRSISESVDCGARES